MPVWTYKKAGVDIDGADEFLKRIRPLLRGTRRPGVLGTIGGFGGFFRPSLKAISDPVLVASTDGVGTKILLAERQGVFDTVGIDLVAMCVNDVVVTGAEPLFFLDYIAVGRLEPDRLVKVMRGITSGCRKAGCALIGGETAELPGLYAGDKFDLAGFCVGVVDRRNIVDGRRVRKGDRVLGLASSGLHSNGFSLVRKVFSTEELAGPLGRRLLRPTRIFVPVLLKAQRRFEIKAMAHITGGGFIDNIPRVLPAGVSVRIRKNSWPVPGVFRRIQRGGRVGEREMFRTLNMGIGMVLVVSPQSVERALGFFASQKQKAWVIGDVIGGDGGVDLEGS